MKENKYLFYSTVGIVMICISCQSQNSGNIVPEEKAPNYIVNDVPIMFPGNFYISDERLILENPRATKHFLIAYDKNDGEKINEFCERGNSNIEFIQPNILVSNDIATVYDLNKSNCVKYSLDDLRITENHTNINKSLSELYSLCQINSNTIVGINFMRRDNIITLCNNTDTLYSFGNLPCKGDYVNYNYANSGKLRFNKNDSTLYFFSNVIPYYEKYSFKNGILKLLISNEYKKFDYKIDESKNISFTSDDIKIFDIVLTKNYIINLVHTKEEYKEYLEYRGPNEISKSPRNLYLYDYNLNLVRIVKLNVPIVRIAGNVESNDIFMVNFDDAVYKISKIEL